MQAKMHPVRLALQKEYDAAVKLARELESGIDLSAWTLASSRAAHLRRQLVEAELSHPTQAETKRRTNALRLRNRGLDC